MDSFYRRVKLTRKLKDYNLRFKYHLFFSLLIQINFLAGISAQHSKVQTWYDSKNTILKESYFVLSKNPSVLDSLYISYYHNGKIKSTGNYNKNKAEGLWEYFYENGNMKMKGNLKDNVAGGHWMYYYENGGLNMEGKIEKGFREGEWKHFYENGKTKSTGNYNKGQKDGMWRYFYEDGTYKAQGIFENDKGRYMEVYPSGEIKSEGEIVDGKSNGAWKYYHENAQLKAEGTEKDGLKDGYWKYYFSNGTIASEGEYVKGKESGKWKYYHENGKLSAEGNIKEGQKDGYWKLYYKDGTFKAEGNFKEGDGSYKEYYESGKLKIEGSVKKNKNEGEWKYYYESGAPEGNCFFTDGKGHYTGYYESGKLKMEGMIDNGNKTGVWKLYNENGQIEGYYKTYYEDEVPVFIPVKDEKDTAKVDKETPIIKPPARLPKKRSRHFITKVNEYKGFIIGVQPLGIIRSHFPVSLEYYFQERLGYEINYTIHRNPFFKSSSSLPVNAVYKRGFSTYLRQKLYNKDKDNGMFYWAQEIRLTSLDYYVNTLDTLTLSNSLLHTNEKRYEFSILIGDRILQDAKHKSWTIDIFGGVGVGYRYLSKNYQDDPKKDALFLGLKTSSVTIPLRLGFSVGYLF